MDKPGWAFLKFCHSISLSGNAAVVSQIVGFLISFKVLMNFSQSTFGLPRRPNLFRTQWKSPVPTKFNWKQI